MPRRVLSHRLGTKWSSSLAEAKKLAAPFLLRDQQGRRRLALQNALDRSPPQSSGRLATKRVARNSMPPALAGSLRFARSFLVAPIGSAGANPCRLIQSSRSHRRPHPNRQRQFGSRRAPTSVHQASTVGTERRLVEDSPVAG